MSLRSIYVVAGVGFVALLYGASPASAQATAPGLGSLATHAIVSDTYTNSLNAGLETAIVGNVCFTTGPATPPMSVVGALLVLVPPERWPIKTAPWRFSMGRPVHLSAGVRLR